MTFTFYDIDNTSIPAISVDEFLSKCLLAPKGYQYRGQGDVSWDLVPSAFRDNNGVTKAAVERTRAINYFVAGDQFTNDFDRIQALAGPDEKIITPENKGAKLLLMLTFFQHFGIPTPLLDWTSSPLVALFMAMFDRPKGANNASIYRLDPTLLPNDVTFQQYTKIQFTRMKNQLGGIMFFGTCTDTNIVVHPHIYSEYITNPNTCRFIHKMNIEILSTDKDKIGNALQNNGFREDVMFPNSMQWVVKQIRDNMG